MSVEQKILFLSESPNCHQSRELRLIALEVRKMEDRIKHLEDRIKQMEEAGDMMVQHFYTDEPRSVMWEQSKEAKP